MSKLYLGGIPTGPDVKRMHEAFDARSVGESITHTEVEAVLEVDRHSNRYRTVTSAWRRERLGQDNVEIGVIPGEGFKVLTPSERVSSNIKGFQSGTRKQGKSLRRVAMVKSDSLTPVERTKVDHFQRIGARIMQESLTMMREIEPPKPQAQITQIRRAVGDGN